MESLICRQIYEIGGHGDAQAVALAAVAAHIDGQIGRDRRLSLGVQPAEYVIFLDGNRVLHQNQNSFDSTEKSGETTRGGGILPRPCAISLFSCLPASVGEADAALGATTSQDLAAVAGSHALAEAMDLGAMPLLGLIGTNHAGTPPVLNDGTLVPPSTTARRARRGQ